MRSNDGTAPSATLAGGSDSRRLSGAECATSTESLERYRYVIGLNELLGRIYEEMKMSSELTIADNHTGARIELPSIGLGTMRTSATYAAMFIALEGERHMQISVLNSVCEALKIDPAELLHYRAMPDVCDESRYSAWAERADELERQHAP